MCREHCKRWKTSFFFVTTRKARIFAAEHVAIGRHLGYNFDRIICILCSACGYVWGHGLIIGLDKILSLKILI